jgi:SNF2 family DNA or RNA helicase
VSDYLKSGILSADGIRRLNESNHNKNSTRCTSCDIAVAVEARRKSVGRGGSNLPPSSAKIKKVIDLLTDVVDRGVPEGEDPEKVIIFSQFTSFRASLYLVNSSH